MLLQNNKRTRKGVSSITQQDHVSILKAKINEIKNFTSSPSAGFSNDKGKNDVQHGLMHLQGTTFKQYFSIIISKSGHRQVC